MIDMKKYFHNLEAGQVPRFDSGQAMMVAVLFFVAVSMTMIFGLAGPVLRQQTIVRDFTSSRQSYFLAEAGIEDVVYRLKTGKEVSTTEVLSLNGETTTITTTDTVDGKEVVAIGDVLNSVRKVRTNLAFGTGISFHYGIQAGMGGFVLKNSSSITGNVFSGGSVTGSGNTIYGDVVSAGPLGLIDGIHATGTAFAHNIRETTSNPTIIEMNAYYVNKDEEVTISGILYPDSPDQDIIPLPISDEQISEWESDAEAGGIMLSSDCDNYNLSSNTCTIDTTRSLGPKKIPFNLLVKTSSGILTMTGPLWVVGNFTTQTGPTVRIDPSLGNKNVALIADNPSNQSGSGIITVGQTTIFQGSGHPNSFVFLISQNNSSETGGSTDAVSMNQGASALVAYASHGQITLSQSVSFKAVTAYKIVLTQSANVVYDMGLPSVLFNSGPSGGYGILDWVEIE